METAGLRWIVASRAETNVTEGAFSRARPTERVWCVVRFALPALPSVTLLPALGRGAIDFAVVRAGSPAHPFRVPVDRARVPLADASKPPQGCYSSSP